MKYYNLYTERNKSLQSLQRSSFKSAGTLVRVTTSLQRCLLGAAHYSQLVRLGISPPNAGAKPFRGMMNPWKAGGLACVYRIPAAKN